MTESKKASEQTRAPSAKADAATEKVDLEKFLDRMNRDFAETLAHLAK